MPSGPLGPQRANFRPGAMWLSENLPPFSALGPCRARARQAALAALLRRRRRGAKRLRGKGRQGRVRRSQQEPLDYIKIVLWVICPSPRRASGRGRRSFATGSFRSASPTGGVAPHDQPRLFDFPYEEASLKSITIGKFMGIFR